MKLFSFFNKKSICIILVCFLLKIGLTYGIEFYFNYINMQANKLTVNKNIVYAKSHSLESENDFYILNIKEDINKISNELSGNKSIFYKIDNSSFYLELVVSNEDIIIKRVIDDKHKINARINYTDVLSVEWQEGNINKSVLLKINTSSYSKYLAITDNNYYFLGSDIDEIIYKDNQFYYLKYNDDYKILKDAKKCDEKTRDLIDNFSYNDYYYKSGEINFLKDYYQKLKPSYYSVKSRCNDLKKVS